MAESPSSDDLDYWCYSCDKRVSVETLSEVVCFECKNGFVESLSLSTPDPTSSLILRFRPQNNPSPPDQHNHDDDDDDNDNDDDHSVVVIPEGVIDDDGNDDDDVDNDDDDDVDVDDDYEDDDENDDDIETRRRRDDFLRLRLRDFTTRSGSQRNRILDWAEILMGLEDHSIHFRLHVPDSDTYVGNPGDYVDAAGYEALLHNFAEESEGGRRGAPPAAKWAVEKLESVVIGKEDEESTCAICKEVVNVGEVVKNMPCGHGYHGECIVTWLFSRNSCPVCRFELGTDDVEYEEERKKRDEVGVGSTSGYDSG